jgi:MFS family permease
LDFRPVFHNSAAMGWIAGYTVHTLELAALRAWGVTFIATVVAAKGAPSWLPDPTVLFTLAGLVGIVVSVSGNESAQRWGRRRVVTAAMTMATILSLTTGWAGTSSALAAAALVMLWNAAIYFDSSALTAGTVQTAGKELRGATMGLHSMCGYAGGCIGPLGVGFVLDLVGNSDALGWGLAFGHIAIFTLVGLTILHRVGRRTASPALAAAT